jgi:hypothetical protein
VLRCEGDSVLRKSGVAEIRPSRHEATRRLSGDWRLVHFVVEPATELTGDRLDRRTGDMGRRNRITQLNPAGPCHYAGLGGTFGRSAYFQVVEFILQLRAENRAG